MTIAANLHHGRRAAEEVLRATVATRFTGRVDMTSVGGELARVWFADGFVLAAAVPGPRPRLGVRLLSAGLLQPEDLDAALKEQATQASAEPLGVMLVRRGAIDRTEVDHVARIQLVDQVADLLGWELVGAAQFSGDRPSAALDQAMPVDEVIRLARARREVWEMLVNRLGGAQGVLRPSMLAAPRANLLLGPYDWAVLMKVDGVRTLEVLAADCGLSMYETAQIVDALANVGLVVLPAPGPPARSGPPEPPAPSARPAQQRPAAAGPPRPTSESVSEAPAESDADARRRASVDTAALLKELSALNRGSGTE